MYIALFALLCFCIILYIDYHTKWKHNILALLALECLIVAVGSAIL